MPEPTVSAVLCPPGVQPALFHVPSDAPPVYTVHDRDGRVQTRTTSLGVAATAVRLLVNEHGEAWVRAGDGTTARVDRHGVDSDQPDHPWIRILTSTWEATR